MQELHTLCSSELRLRDSGAFPEAVVSVLLEECKFADLGSLMSVFSVCEESHGEDDVCLADKWRMMLHWSEITSLSHCKETTVSKENPDKQNKLLAHVWTHFWPFLSHMTQRVPVVALHCYLRGWMGELPKCPSR